MFVLRKSVLLTWKSRHLGDLEARCADKKYPHTKKCPSSVQETVCVRRCVMGFLLLRENTKSYEEREGTANIFEGWEISSPHMENISGRMSAREGEECDTEEERNRVRKYTTKDEIEVPFASVCYIELHERQGGTLNW